MATITAPLTEQERAERRVHIEQALASARLEGLEPSTDAAAIFEKYVSGERTLDEVGAEIRALHARHRGPVRLPGD
jgi:hypothetical protein